MGYLKLKTASAVHSEASYKVLRDLNEVLIIVKGYENWTHFCMLLPSFITFGIHITYARAGTIGHTENFCRASRRVRNC